MDSLFSEDIYLVDVAVPVPLRMTFTYRVPPDVDGENVKKGYRVLVPFRNRLIHGITMTEAYKADEVADNIRYLNSYDDRQCLLRPDIARLLDWLVRYYKAPIGEAVKLVLPPGTLIEREFIFALTEVGETFAKEAPEGRIVGLLEGRKLDHKQWEALAQTKILWRQIREWEQAGYVEMIARGKGRDTIPHTTAVTLSGAGAMVDLEELKRAPKQQELLKWLRKHSATLVETSEINEAFKNGSTLTAELEKKGFVERKRIPKHELDVANSSFERDEAKILTAEQQAAFDNIVADLDDGEFHANLIFGVTGAGKTEVYLRAIQHCLEQGRQALFLVPEIGLTPLMQRRIVDRFGDRLAILHSAVGMGQRTENWARVLAGKVDVVLGARSGIFAPLPRLGLVIVDEEHDHSYKQNDGIRYHARDLAMVRANFSSAVVVLGSATPSLESWHHQVTGRSRLLTIKKRATSARLPDVEIVDMREEFKAQRCRPVLSNLLAERLALTLEAGQQAMVLLNRRGYHAFMMCRKCGDSMGCSQCEVNLTYHATDRTLKCHYCGETKHVPELCPVCESPASMMQFFGEGTQQIQEYIQNLFPEHVIDRLDRDRMTRREAAIEILSEFGRGKSHVLVGTQMIAKGHDFPNVTLVGILNADQGLRIPDFRAAETTFQLLTQVAGRSGRGDKPGSVVVQTYMPEHYSIVNAAKHDFLTFLKKEDRFRRGMFYSPYAHMVAILVTHENMELAQGVTTWMADQLFTFREEGKLVVLGPARAPVGKIKGAWRFQIVVKSPKRAVLHRLCDAVTAEAVKRKLLPQTAIILDIDPYQFF